MTRCTSPAINPAMTCIMFRDDTDQPYGIEDHKKRPDGIIQIGAKVDDPVADASIEHAAVVMTRQKRQHPFRTFPIGDHPAPAASS